MKQDNKTPNTATDSERSNQQVNIHLLLDQKELATISVESNLEETKAQ